MATDRIDNKPTPQEIVQGIRDIAYAGQYRRAESELAYFTEALKGVVSPLEILNLRIQAREAYAQAVTPDEMLMNGGADKFAMELDQLKTEKLAIEKQLAQ